MEREDLHAVAVGASRLLVNTTAFSGTVDVGSRVTRSRTPTSEDFVAATEAGRDDRNLREAPFPKATKTHSLD